MNLHFIGLIILLTIRVVTYTVLRLTSTEKLLEWTLIQPTIFYITYGTDMVIAGGMLYFVWQAAPSESDMAKIDQYDHHKDQPNSPLNHSYDGAKSEENRSEIDGDEMIRR